MKNYYADFLQTKNFENTPDKAVSKVSKGQNQTRNISFDTFDTVLPSENRKTKAEINFQKTETDKLAPTHTTQLNAMIAAGVSFEVATDDFQAFDASERESVFLRNDKPQVLCTLQQCALQKYLSLDDLQMFIDEIRERAAILSDGLETEPLFEIVRDVTGEWFADLLDEMPDRQQLYE